MSIYDTFFGVILTHFFEKTETPVIEKQKKRTGGDERRNKSSDNRKKNHDSCFLFSPCVLIGFTIVSSDS